MADSRANHPQHDLELVGAWAAGEATGADLERAERLLDACDLCVDIARDLRVITLALQELPAVDAMTALPPAPRDFRLTPEQAARLRPSAPLARWTDRLIAVVAAFGKPVGASLATLGLVGLIVGAASLGALAGGTSLGAAATAPTSAPAAADNLASAAAQGNEGAGAGTVPAATTASGGIELGPIATDSRRGAYSGAGASVAPTGARPGSPGVAKSNDAAAPGPATWLLILSLAALVGGIGLIVVATRRG